MPSDYEQICKDNIRRRGEEFDDIGRLISEQLYSDRTHFIYELLQNAEDALGRRKRNNPESKLPTNVKFLLYKDRLEFRHFGEKFNTDDVKAITDVLKGTKSEDKTQIGKFGIGFKSVYAFTSIPEIHSGDEHFIIERYIRPQRADIIPQIADGETVFVFPFNHKDLSKEQAFHLIEEKLNKIGSRVLLFLRNITEIEWKIEEQDEGVYLKDSKQQGQFAQKVTVIGQHGNEDEEEEWLVFRRQIEAVNSSVDSFVEVAFRLKDDGKLEKQIIQKTEFSPLIVYFPTEKSTRFGFLIQGPYRTTPSRDNIPKDDDWNTKLIKETALLLVDALQSLKKMGLLTVALLNALPIRMDDFPEDGMFYPIVEAVRDALLDRELLPADDGTFVSARNAKLARGAELRKLLSSNQLQGLFSSKETVKWLSGEITQDRTPDLRSYLINELNVEEITPDGFARKTTAAFLKKQTDEWMIAFYRFLNGQEALWRKGSGSLYNPDGPLRKKSFIRLQDGTHVRPFNDDDLPNAFLLLADDTEFPVVKRDIAKDEKALEFLKKLELTEPDIVAEVIKHVLPEYSQSNSDISNDEHHRDMKKILHAYSTDSQKKKNQLTKKLQETSFIRAENLVLQQIEYKKPEQLYFKNEEVIKYFEGNKDAWFVSSEYDACFNNLFKDLGVHVAVYVKRRMPGWNRHVIIENSHGSHKRGLNGFDPDIEVDGLKYALKHPTLEKSLFIWSRIAIENSDCIRGIVESSSRKTYEDSKKQEKISHNFGRLLMDTPWLPDKQGNFHKPAELKLEDLPEAFVRDEKLVNQLGMKKDVVAKLAEEAGISPDTINIAKELEKRPELLEEFRKKIRPVASDKESTETETDTDKICYKDELQKSFNRPGETELKKQVIDTGKVNDSDRRREKSFKRHKASFDSEPNPEERRRETTRTILEGPDEQVREYLSQLYSGKCQICGKTFPERDGKPFFIANYIVLRKFARFVDTPANALCLCADHFAKWQHGAVEAEGIIGQIENFKTESEGGNTVPAVRIKLCGEECKITFTEKHLLDLQELLSASENQKGEAL